MTAPNGSTGHLSRCTPTTSVWARISKRPLGPVSPQARDEIGTAWIKGEGAGGDAFALQDLLQVFDRLRLVASRGVDLYQGPVVIQDLGEERFPIDGPPRGRRLRVWRGEGNNRERKRKKTVHAKLPWPCRATRIRKEFLMCRLNGSASSLGALGLHLFLRDSKPCRLAKGLCIIDAEPSNVAA